MPKVAAVAATSVRTKQPFSVTTCRFLSMCIPKPASLPIKASSNLPICVSVNNSSLLQRAIQLTVNTIQVRTKKTYTRVKGKPSTVDAVTQRFFRLYNGLWIRTRAGRHKRLWKKSLRRRNRLEQHVFCNKTQCRLLDKMTEPYFKTPKYYVNDPYAPYHRKLNLTHYRSPPKMWYP